MKLRVYKPMEELIACYQLRAPGKAPITLRVTPYRLEDGTEDCNIEFEIDKGKGTQEIVDVACKVRDMGESWQVFIDRLKEMGYRVQLQ